VTEDAGTGGLSAPARAALTPLIDRLAHDKAAMGLRYGEWAVSAPTLESAVAAAAMAQDELGHARSIFPLLKQLGAESLDEDRMGTHSEIRLLNEPLPTWESFIAVNLVIDRMLDAFVDAARASAFTQLAQRARKIEQEEQSHRAHAAAWARRLARDDAGAGRLAGSIGDCLQQVEDWPGQDDGYAVLVADGILTGSPDGLRAATREAVAHALAGTRLETVVA
jgi:1,2-phenylacetyl-CoA epoxidase catalytic subunit